MPDFKLVHFFANGETPNGVTTCKHQPIVEELTADLCLSVLTLFMLLFCCKRVVFTWSNSGPSYLIYNAIINELTLPIY